MDAEALADAVGVTATTVRNHSDELESHEDVGSMKIDRARVYYYLGERDPRPEPNAEDRPAMTPTVEPAYPSLNNVGETVLLVGVLGMLVALSSFSAGVTVALSAWTWAVVSIFWLLGGAIMLALARGGLWRKGRRLIVGIRGGDT